MTARAALTHIHDTVTSMAARPGMYGTTSETVLCSALALLDVRATLLGGDDSRASYDAAKSERGIPCAHHALLPMAEIGPFLADLYARERQRVPDAPTLEERLQDRLAQTQADLEAARLTGERLADPTYRFRGAMCAEDTHGLIQVMAESFVALLDARGADNFLTQELDFKPSGGPRVVVTIQRATGKTPAERYWEVATELAALKETTPEPLEGPPAAGDPRHHCRLDEATGRVCCTLCGAAEQVPEGRGEVVIATLRGFEARHAGCPERVARAVSVDVLEELRRP